MRILLVHNTYLQRGGEDAVYEAERELLRAGGHEVHEYRVDNTGVDRMSRLQLAAAATLGTRSRRAIARMVREHGIEVAHFHNLQPLISPAAFRAARRAGAAVVHTLHNYRLVCPSATLFRDGAACTECVGRKLALPAIRHACYRGSRAATAVVAAGTALHHLRGTWRRDVDAYIALTRFQRDLLVGSGLPGDRVLVVPNFLAEDPGHWDAPGGNGILFVGRLTEEKGVRTLLAAARLLPRQARVRFVGSGPLGSEVAAAAAADARIVAVGVCSAEQVREEMRRAAVLAVPSLWYEGLPMTIVEAFACSLPVVASDIGGLPSLVVEDVNGCLARVGDAADLARALGLVIAERATRTRLASGARASFLAHHTAAAHHESLMEVYGAAIERRRSGGATARKTVAIDAPSGSVAAETPVRSTRR